MKKEKKYLRFIFKCAENVKIQNLWTYLQNSRIKNMKSEKLQVYLQRFRIKCKKYENFRFICKV